MIQRDEIDSGKLAVIGIVGAILVLVTGLLVKVLYHQIELDLFTTKNLPAPRTLVNYTNEQQERLHRYAWVDKDKQVVAIPIEQAMALTVRDLQADKKAGDQPQPPQPQQPKSPN